LQSRMWALCAIVVVAVAADESFWLSNATSAPGLMDWDDPAAWRRGTAPPASSPSAMVHLVSEAGAARIGMSSKKSASWGLLEFGPTTLVASNDISLQLDHLELGDGSSLVVSAARWTVEVRAASCNVTRFCEVANTFEAPLSTLSCDELHVDGSSDSAFFLTGFNLTAKEIQLAPETHFQFGPGALVANTIDCEEASCVVQFAGQVILSAQTVRGGYYTNVWSQSSPQPLVLSLPRTTVAQLALSGSGNANLYVVFILGTLEVHEAVHMSYLDLHSAPDRVLSSTSAPLIEVRGNLSFARQSFIDSGGVDVPAISFLPGSVWRFEARGALEARTGVLSVVSSEMVMESLATLIVLSGSKLSITDSNIVGSADAGVSVLGVAELTGFSNPQFLCTVGITLFGGSFVSNGVAPQQITFTETVRLETTGSAAMILAPHAQVAMGELTFFGGRVFCGSLSVAVIRMYLSGANSVSCRTVVQDSIRFTVDYSG
jgi:hypothetical protein